VTTLSVRWIYRTVCTLVSLVVGVVALIFGNTAILKQAQRDLWELVKDAFYTSVGAVIHGVIYLVDGIQSIFGLQKKKRRLTERERGILWKVFRYSLIYDAISVVDGNAGLLSISGRAFTMGFTIYMPVSSEVTLVHECVHVWQFQSEGTEYIGNSALNQFDSMFTSKGYMPYSWVNSINAGDSWYTLKSVEAQAQFIEDVFIDGEFVPIKDPTHPDKSPGAFFTEDDENGHNRFEYGGSVYTDAANQAWRIIRSG